MKTWKRCSLSGTQVAMDSVSHTTLSLLEMATGITCNRSFIPLIKWSRLFKTSPLLCLMNSLDSSAKKETASGTKNLWELLAINTTCGLSTSLTIQGVLAAGSYSKLRNTIVNLTGQLSSLMTTQSQRHPAKRLNAGFSCGSGKILMAFLPISLLVGLSLLAW